MSVTNTPILAALPVVILAGGLGTRLRPVLPEQPKGLAPIGRQTFLEIQIQLLRSQGARRFVLCVGHQADQIQAAMGDGRRWDAEIEYSLEQPGRLLGTAGALKHAEHFFAPRALVLNGDTYFAIAYERLVQQHLAAREAATAAVATLALSEVSEQRSFGRVSIDATGQWIVAFQEKPTEAAGRNSWVSAGAYVLERELLDLVPEGQACSLEQDVFPRALATGRPLGARTSSQPFFDIGTPAGWRAFAEFYGGAMRTGQPER